MPDSLSDLQRPGQEFDADVVTQADRDAAADWLLEDGLDMGYCADVRAGRTDGGLARAFARHRIAAIAADRPMIEARAWRPIESAPKDQTGTGRLILLLDTGHPDDYDSRVIPGFWGDRLAGLSSDGREEPTWLNWHEGFAADGSWHHIANPTHWMPLPAPPSIEPRS